MNTETQKAIVNNEIDLRNNTIYLLQIRHRVGKKLGNEPAQLKAWEDEIVQNELAIDELEKILLELDKDV